MMVGETFQSKIAEKQVEANSLREELKRVRLEVDDYRSKLEAAGVGRDSSLAPATIQSARVLTDIIQPELRPFLQWIVSHIDLSRHQVFQCGADQQTIQVAGKDVMMSKMVAWELSRREGLNISVPHELQQEIFGLLSQAQARGHLLESDLLRLSDDWELVVAEFRMGPGAAEPAQILVHRATSKAIFCACWPADIFATAEVSQPLQSPEIPQREPFDFVKHLFKTDVESPEPVLSSVEYQGSFWHPMHGDKHIHINLDTVTSRWTALGYTEDVLISREGNHIVISDRQTKFIGNVDEVGVLRGEAFQEGNEGGSFELSPVPIGTYSTVVEAKEVEVEFGGSWFTGVLQAVQGGIAYVKCDVDMPGVLTVTPMTQIRPAGLPQSAEDGLSTSEDGCAEQVPK